MSTSANAVAAFPGAPLRPPGAWVEDELARLMGEYERPLLFRTRSLLRDADLALDCVQETFLRAYETLCRGRQVNKRWLFTVARSRAVDELRRRRWVQAEPEHLVAAPFTGPSETGMSVRQAMDGLSQRHREVLYLFVIAGFKTDEIAELLGTSGPAVRERLYRARQEFRRVYGGAQETTPRQGRATRYQPSQESSGPVARSGYVAANANVVKGRKEDMAGCRRSLEK